MTPDRRRLLKIKNWLVDNFPGKYPVRVIVQSMPRDMEDCFGTYVPPESSKYSTIWISSDLVQSQKIETLIHEWAHYRTDPDADRHGQRYGGHTNAFYLEFGRIEREYYEALDNELGT